MSKIFKISMFFLTIVGTLSLFVGEAYASAPSLDAGGGAGGERTLSRSISLIGHRLHPSISIDQKKNISIMPGVGTISINWMDDPREDEIETKSTVESVRSPSYHTITLPVTRKF